MKHNYKLIVLLMAGLTIAYTACKKTTTSPTKSTVSPKVASQQIAANLSSIFTASNGGFDFSNGLDIPANLTFSKKGKLKVESTVQNPQCGFKIDTVLTLHLDDSDTSKLDLWTRIKYELSCTNGVASNLTIYDSLNMTGVSGGYKIAAKEGENLLLKSLVPGVRHSKFSFDGTINATSSLISTVAGQKSAAGTFYFSFNNVVIDPNNDSDILSGSATFSSKGNIGTGVWDYKGTIEFLGGHKAKIVIEGQTFTANLLTGLIE